MLWSSRAAAPARSHRTRFARGKAHQAAVLNGTNFGSGALVRSHAGITIQATFVSPAAAQRLGHGQRSAVATGRYSLWVTNPDGSHGGMRETASR